MIFLNKKMLKAVWNIIRFPAIIFILYMIFRKVSIETLIKNFSLIQWFPISLFLLCAVLGLLFQGIRWWLLIYAFTKELRFVRSMSIHLSSVFYSLVLPNSTVQEIVRTVYASKTTGYVVGWSSAWICKIMGLIVSFSLSAIGLLLLPKIKLPLNAIHIVLALYLLICIALVLSFTKKLTRPIRKFIATRFPSFSLTWFENLREGIYCYRNKKKYLVFSLFVTILAQIALLSSVSILLFAITGQPYIIEVLAFIPLIEMISMAQPFTPGGIGVREALVAIMFKQLHLSTEQLATYVIVSNLSIFVKFLGAIPILWGMIKKNRNKTAVKI
jgi:uncharacterized protein (TIRG00374 family)